MHIKRFSFIETIKKKEVSANRFSFLQIFIETDNKDQ